MELAAIRVKETWLSPPFESRLRKHFCAEVLLMAPRNWTSLSGFDATRCSLEVRGLHQALRVVKGF